MAFGSTLSHWFWAGLVTCFVWWDISKVSKQRLKKLLREAYCCWDSATTTIRRRLVSLWIMKYDVSQEPLSSWLSVWVPDWSEVILDHLATSQPPVGLKWMSKPRRDLPSQTRPEELPTCPTDHDLSGTHFQPLNFRVFVTHQKWTNVKGLYLYPSRNLLLKGAVFWSPLKCEAQAKRVTGLLLLTNSSYNSSDRI